MPEQKASEYFADRARISRDRRDGAGSSSSSFIHDQLALRYQQLSDEALIDEETARPSDQATSTQRKPEDYTWLGHQDHRPGATR